MTIKFKSIKSKEYKNYVGIGRANYDSAEEFQWHLPHSYALRDKSKEKWDDDFKNSVEGFQLDLINYLFQFDEFSCPEITKKLMKEKERVKKIIDYYYHGGTFERGLDFYGLDDEDGYIIEEEIFEDEDDEDPIEIRFEDGSVILSPDKEDYIRYNRFIPEEEHDKLIEDVKFMVDLIFVGIE